MHCGEQGDIPISMAQSRDLTYSTLLFISSFIFLLEEITKLVLMSFNLLIDIHGYLLFLMLENSHFLFTSLIIRLFIFPLTIHAMGVLYNYSTI